MDSRTFLRACLVICFLVLLAQGEQQNIQEAEEVRSVRDVPVQIDYEPVGCFKDKRNDRALREMVINYRGPANWPPGRSLWTNWPDMSEVIQRCAEQVFQRGYAMFGLQFFGECRSDSDAVNNYNLHGISDNCINGVGKHWTNFVYRITARPLPVRAPSSICNVAGQTFDDGDDMEVYKGDLKNAGECDQCTCSGGELIDCHHIFHCNQTANCNSYRKVSGQCCPICEEGVQEKKRDVRSNNAPVCEEKGQMYKSGDGMEVLKDSDAQHTAECHQCTCVDGKREKCHFLYYCKLNKPGCINLIKTPGQCCPKCARVVPKPAPPYCKVTTNVTTLLERYYADGESMEILKMSEDKKSASCHQCICKKGEKDGCHHLFKCTLDDPKCERYEQKSDQCCPACVPFQSGSSSAQPQAILSCSINGQSFKDGESGEVLQESADKSSVICRQCRCDGGKHRCHHLYDCDIQKVACEKSIKIDGQCCPVCACYNNGQQLSPGDHWQKTSGSDCVTCTCDKDGETANCTRMPGSCQ